MDDRERDFGALLIVEDHDDTRQTLREYLEQVGYAVDTAVDGVEGLARARARAYDLVITDHHMPRVGGLELIAAIKREAPGPDVLMLSADSQVGRAVEAMKLGAVNYLVKPIDVEDLIAEVRAVLRARRERALRRSPPDVVRASRRRAAGRETPRAKPPAQPASAADDEIPTSIARYQVLSKIGSGGMGTIYKCFDPKLGRTVAVKVVDTESDLRGQQELLARFAGEARAAGMLRHPNIVTVYDYCAEPDGPVYLTMEYLSGEPLGALMAAAGRLPWQRVVGLAFQLADALEFAHRNQVIHRDVKPANVLVLAGDRVKLLDFGIAKLANAELTIPGTFVGSPRYLAPETFRGVSVDYRVDQFSLGSVLYEMLAGAPAFDFSDFYAGVDAIISESPSSLEDLGLDAPSLLYDVMDRLHQKDPDRRYHNEMRLLDDLMELGELAGLTLHLGVAREGADRTP